jgi:hypothetical protein
MVIVAGRRARPLPKGDQAGIAGRPRAHARDHAPRAGRPSTWGAMPRSSVPGRSLRCATACAMPSPRSAMCRCATSSGWSMRSLLGRRSFRAGHGIAQALRQVLDAAVRSERMTRNPAKAAGRNPKPPPRAVRAFTRAELDAIAAELAPAFQPLPLFAAATGLRPEEWQALERRDVDRRAGLVHVRRSVSSGEIVELGKTERSRRQVPLSPWAEDALDAIPPRLDTPLIFPGLRGGILNLDNFRRRAWDRPSMPVERAGLRGSTTCAPRSPQLPCCRYRRVRAGQGHGHVHRDDRASLRHTPRRCERRDR